MSREIITISKMGAVTVPTAPVWMTQFEIADLFGGVLLQYPQDDTGNLQEQRVERN